MGGLQFPTGLKMVIFFIIQLLMWCKIDGENTTEVKGLDIDIQHDIPIIILDDDHITDITFNYSLNTNNDLEATFDTKDITKVNIKSQKTFVLNETSDSFILSLHGDHIGRTDLTIHVGDYRPNSEVRFFNKTLYKSYEVITSREERIVDTIFNVVVILLVVIANVAMGCKVELHVVKETLRRPLAPAIGMFSQFLVMPAISFLIVYLIDMEPGIALGYFALGCSPGGSASNVYTYLFGGEVSLSVTMTLVSTLASLGLIPLWLFTVGQKVIYKGTTMNIPFSNIFISLTGLLVPVVIGIIIQKKKPSWAKKLVKLVKPIIVIFLLFVFTVGVYANLYIFDLLDPMILLAGALIPYGGFFLGFLIAFVARQPKKNIITIAIETGIQNTGIPIVLLKNSLGPPESDMSIVGPVASAIFTPLPLVFVLIALEIRKRFCKKKADDNDMDMLNEPATFSKLPSDGGSPIKSTNDNGQFKENSAL